MRHNLNLFISYPMFVGFRILVGSSSHSLYSTFFVLATEIMPEPMRVANGAIFNSGLRLPH